jgi:hypothetical protein
MRKIGPSPKLILHCIQGRKSSMLSGPWHWTNVNDHLEDS